MIVSESPLSSLAPPHAVLSPAPIGRADESDARWFVRIVLMADATAVVQSVRVIIEDRDVQQIVLHSVWTDWHDMPILAARIPSPLPAREPLDSIAWDLAVALLVSLQIDPDACLAGLGSPVGSLPMPPPGPQERAALRNARDAAMA